jgi:hypothetical protein
MLQSNTYAFVSTNAVVNSSSHVKELFRPPFSQQLGQQEKHLKIIHNICQLGLFVGKNQDMRKKNPFLDTK